MRLIIHSVLVLYVAAAPLTAAAPPIDPAGLPGPLVLAGGDKVSEDARKAFFELAGKDKAKLVVLADAEGEASAKKLAKAWEEAKPASVRIVTASDRKQADEAAVAIAEASGVWLAPGDAGKLAAAIRGSRAEEALKKFHARGGVIGASAASEALAGGWLVEAGKPTGLGLLPGFVIDPHFAADKKRLPGVIAAHPDWVGLGFDSGSAMVIRGRVGRVIGDSPVVICVAKGGGRPAAADDHPAGSLLDIVQLRRAAANRAEAEPFPPAKPPAPAVEKGTLVIVGGGGAGPEIWNRFIAASGGPEATIVVVTTAMEDPVPKESGEEKTLKAYGARHVVALHTRSRREADDPAFSDVLKRAGGVWFSGGRQWRFVDSYAGTLTEKRFHEVLSRGGAIGGSSAGASIQSEYMPRGHPLGNTVMAAEGYEHGFGFLPGCAVDQHFFARHRTADMTGLMNRYPQYLGIGLDEGTAIVVRGSTAEVIGKSRVAFYDAKKPAAGGKDYEELKAGEKYDLKERKKVEP